MKTLTGKSTTLLSSLTPSCRKLLRCSLLILLFAILTTSCQTTTDPSIPSATPQTQTAAMLPMEAMMAPFAPAKQTFKVPGDKPSVVTGKAGTKIHVLPQNLTMPDGSPVTGEIEVNLIECTRKSELLAAGLQTMSDGKLLESGGSYYIDMQAAGQALAIKTGEHVEVEFPQMTDKPMELFYGDKDASGQINWSAADVDFVPNRDMDTATNPALSRELAASDTNYAYVSGNDSMQSDNIQDIFAYLDEEDAKHTKKELREHNNEQARQQRREAAERKESERKSLAEADQARKEQSRLNRANGLTDSGNRELTTGIHVNYHGQNLRRFGWYNCDRFINQKSSAPVMVSLPNNSEPRIVYYVLKNINAIISMYEGPNFGQQSFANLPDGEKVEIFVVQGDFANDKLEFAHGITQAGKAESLELQPMPTAMDEIKAAFDAI